MTVTEGNTYLTYGLRLFVSNIETLRTFGFGVFLSIGRKNFKKTILPEGKRQPDSEQID
jgi:hypothetical protein